MKERENNLSNAADGVEATGTWHAESDLNVEIRGFLEDLGMSDVEIKAIEQDRIEPPKDKEKSLPQPTSSTTKKFPNVSQSASPDGIELRSRLCALMRELASHKDYYRVRDEYCQISIWLNLEGLWAPAFRTPVKRNLGQGNNVYFEIHRDQVVIDCHWLHCLKDRIRVKPRDEEWKPLFDHRSDFPFDLASEFVHLSWKSEHRATQALMLTTKQQCQLAALRGKEVKKRFELALLGEKQGRGRTAPKIANVRKRLNEWGELNKNILNHLDDYEHLWLARELLTPEAPVSHVTELYAWIAGTPPKDVKTVREKLKRLDRQLGGTA